MISNLAQIIMTRRGGLELQALTPEQAADVAQIVGFALQLLLGSLALVYIVVVVLRYLLDLLWERLEARRAARLG